MVNFYDIQMREYDSVESPLYPVYQLLHYEIPHAFHMNIKNYNLVVTWRIVNCVSSQ